MTFNNNFTLKWSKYIWFKLRNDLPSSNLSYFHDLAVTNKCYIDVRGRVMSLFVIADLSLQYSCGFPFLDNFFNFAGGSIASSLIGLVLGFWLFWKLQMFSASPVSQGYFSCSMPNSIFVFFSQGPDHILARSNAHCLKKRCFAGCSSVCHTDCFTNSNSDFSFSTKDCFWNSWPKSTIDTFVLILGEP